MIHEGRRVLVFSAHAADFCSRAGGTVVRLLQAGAAVEIHALSYGERCESPGAWQREPRPTLEAVKAMRREEAEAAAAVLGAPIRFHDFGDSPLIIGPERQHELLGLMRGFRPDLVLTHWREDLLHPDHAEAARAVLWASRYTIRADDEAGHAPAPYPEVVCYETTLGTAPVSGYVPNLYVDIGDVWPRKREALEKLASQPYLADEYEIVARSRAQEARFTAWMKGCRYAESFVRIGTEAGG